MKNATVEYALRTVVTGILLAMMFTSNPARGQGDPPALNRVFLEAASVPSFRSISFDASIAYINDDELPDLLVGEYVESHCSDSEANQEVGWKNRIYINKGDGTFEDASSRMLPGPRGYQTSGVASGPLCGRGPDDLMVFANFHQMPAFLRRQGDQFIAVTDDPARVVHADIGDRELHKLQRFAEIVDLDNDGDSDVVISKEAYTMIYENMGASTGFRLEDRTHEWNASLPGEGTIEISGLNYLRHYGVSRRPVIADIDCDGFPDLLLPTEARGSEGRINRVFLNVPREGGADGARAFRHDDRWFPGDHVYRTITFSLVDWNSDGLLDVYATNREGEPQLYINHFDPEAPHASGPFFQDVHAQSTLPRDPELHRHMPVFAQLNEDEFMDALYYPYTLAGRWELEFEGVIPTRTSEIRCFINEEGPDGGRLMAERENAIYQAEWGQPRRGYGEVLIGDFNNDQIQDVLSVGGDTKIAFGRMTPDGIEFARSVEDRFPHTTDYLINSATIADLNGDGMPDVFSTNNGYVDADNYRRYLQPFKYFLSSTRFGRPYWIDAKSLITYPGGYDDFFPHPARALVGDVDLDGYRDMILLHRDTENFLMLNNGHGEFQADLERMPPDPYRGRNPAIPPVIRERFLFSTRLEHVESLEEGRLPEELRQQINEHLELAAVIEVSAGDGGWILGEEIAENEASEVIPRVALRPNGTMLEIFKILPGWTIDARADAEFFTPLHELAGVRSVETPEGETVVVHIDPTPADQGVVDEEGASRNQFIHKGLVGANSRETPFGARHGILHDFNGDGRLDLYVGYANRKRDRLLIASQEAGDWRFIESSNFPQTNLQENSVLAFDIDKDGDEDLVTAGGFKSDQTFVGSRFYVYLNDGDGEFSADLGQPGDEDDRLQAMDLVDNDSRGWLEEFDGEFITTKDSMTRRDLFGDAEPEIIFVRYFPTRDGVPPGMKDLSIYTRSLDDGGPYRLVDDAVPDSDPVFDESEVRRHLDCTPIAGNLAHLATQAVAFPDINRDGRPDIVTGKQAQKERVYLQQPGPDGADPVFREVTDLVLDPRNFKTYFVHDADMDRDGFDDLVVFGTQGPRLYLNRDRELDIEVLPDRDDDEDGIPDAFELRHTYPPSLEVMDATSDQDGDAFSDLAEFLFGTDPRDPGSTFHFEAVVVGHASGIAVTFTFDSNPARSYQIETSGSLHPEDWTDCGLGVFAADHGGKTRVDITLPTSESPRYFRLRVMGGASETR